MSAGLFVGVDKYLIGGITDATKGLMMSYSSMMMGLAAMSATLYITWRGYQTLAGKLSTPMEDVVWDIMRMAIILSFVANAEGYLDGVIDAINGLKEGFSGSDSIWQLLDSLWNKAKVLGKTLHDMDDSTYIKDEGMTAQFYVWLGVFVLMIVTAFVSMVAEVMILLLSITAPVFIFCLIYGFLRPMFNNWLQNIFAAILTILFSALSLRIVVTYLNLVLDKATRVADNSAIVELGAQVCLAGVCAAILVYISAKLAAAPVRAQRFPCRGLLLWGLVRLPLVPGSWPGAQRSRQRDLFGTTFRAGKMPVQANHPHPEAVQVTTHRKRVNMLSSK